MKVIEYRLDPWTFFFKSFLKVGVHVTCNGLYGFHPLKAYMFDKVIDYLLFLSVRDPKNMACFEIYDMSGVTIAVMKLKLINGKHLGGFFGKDQFLAVDSVELLQTYKINVFYYILTEACYFGHLLKSVCIKGQQITDILMKFY